MAIAGSTVPCVQVSVRNGQPYVGPSERAISFVVYSNVQDAIEAVLRGDPEVRLEMWGTNVTEFRTAVRARLGLPVFK